MNICVLFDTVNSPTGGGNQFLKALISQFVRMGHGVSTRPTKDTDVVLLNGFNYASGRRLRVGQVAEIRHLGRMSTVGRVLPRWCLETLGRRGPVLVHRVDGVPELTRGHRTPADDVQPAVNRLADHTIFQSEFCRESFLEHGGTPSTWSIVNNGVDPRVFFPPRVPPKVDGGLRLVAASWSPNRRKGFATLAALSRIAGVRVVFAGNWSPEIEPEGVELVGVLTSVELAQLMRTASALVHAAWNEPCSNTVVEAMACGLPVIFRDSGGNAELVGDCGVALTDNLHDTVGSLAADYGAFIERVRADRGRFLVDRAANGYIAAFREAVARHQSARVSKH
ncbi:MAG: glycosyltransferase family 4 protein [Gammaproteobacteria bacterium]|nr:glycosyltransferase family 4 protein [Gammaproteobacteria bacterium]